MIPVGITRSERVKAEIIITIIIIIMMMMIIIIMTIIILIISKFYVQSIDIFTLFSA